MESISFCVISLQFFHEPFPTSFAEECIHYTQATSLRKSNSYINSANSVCLFANLLLTSALVLNPHRTRCLVYCSFDILVEAVSGLIAVATFLHGIVLYLNCMACCVALFNRGERCLIGIAKSRSAEGAVFVLRGAFLVSSHQLSATSHVSEMMIPSGSGSMANLEAHL